MFDAKKIESIAIKAKTERWEYPKIFNALKEAGVEYYETKVANHEIIYYGSGKNLTEAVPENFQKLFIAEKFDLNAVKKALHTHQTEKTSYEEFLKGIALAGVNSYRVDMEKRTVSYLGKNPGEEYVEKVPQF